MARLLVVADLFGISLLLADLHDVVIDPQTDVDLIAPPEPGTVDAMVIGPRNPDQVMAAVDRLRGAGVTLPILVVAGYQPAWAEIESSPYDDVVIMHPPITQDPLLDSVATLLPDDPTSRRVRPSSVPDLDTVPLPRPVPPTAEIPRRPTDPDTGQVPPLPPAPDTPATARPLTEVVPSPRPIHPISRDVPQVLEPRCSPADTVRLPVVDRDHHGAPPSPVPEIGRGRAWHPFAGPVPEPLPEPAPEPRPESEAAAPDVPEVPEPATPEPATAEPRESSQEPVVLQLPVATTSPAPEPITAGELVRLLVSRIEEVFGVQDVAQALAEEVVERTDADAAVIMVPDQGVWRVSGGVGLRPVERRLELHRSHWLVEQIVLGDHGLLVEDTDVVRARLTGSPLASWRHLLGVPLSAARGLVLLARGMEMPAFSDRDLKIVLRIAQESTGVFDDSLRARELARLLAPLRDEQPAQKRARVGVSS